MINAFISRYYEMFLDVMFFYNVYNVYTYTHDVGYIVLRVAINCYYSSLVHESD